MKVAGWEEGGRIILEQVDDESPQKRMARAGVMDPTLVCQHRVFEVPPGGAGRGYLSVPRSPGARTVDLRFSGYRYRMAELVFKPKRPSD